MNRFYAGYVNTVYEIGDTVRVVDDICSIADDPNHIGPIGSTMSEMGGKEFTVNRFVIRHDCRVVFDGTYYWLDDWLEPACDVQVPESAFADLFEVF